MKSKILISIFLSFSLFGQQIFLECENRYLSNSNTKWINQECVRVTPIIYDYIEINEDKESFAYYEWDTQTGGAFRTNKDGKQHCGSTYKFGQELIDDQIIRNSTSFLWEDIYNKFSGRASISYANIALNFIGKGDAGFFMQMNLDRMNGKLTDRNYQHSHDCRKIKKTEFKSVINKMKLDNSKVKTALKKHFEKERKF